MSVSSPVISKSIPIKSEPSPVPNNVHTTRENSADISLSVPEANPERTSTSARTELSTPHSMVGSIAVKSEVVFFSNASNSSGGRYDNVHVPDPTAPKVPKDAVSKRRDTVPSSSEPKIKMEKLEMTAKQVRNLSKSKDVIIIEDYTDFIPSQVDVKVKEMSMSMLSSKPPSNVQLLNKPPRVGLSKLQKKFSILHEITVIEAEE